MPVMEEIRNRQPKKKHILISRTILTLKAPVYYTNVPETCGRCHPKELDNFENSTHFKKLESLQLAPTCTTCHHPHTFTILNPEDFRNSCGNCHSVYKKVAPYDIPLRAEDMLRKVNKLKFNIEMARQDIFWAEKNGRMLSRLKNTRIMPLKPLEILPQCGMSSI